MPGLIAPQENGTTASSPSKVSNGALESLSEKIKDAAEHARDSAEHVKTTVENDEAIILQRLMDLQKQGVLQKSQVGNVSIQEFLEQLLHHATTGTTTATGAEGVPNISGTIPAPAVTAASNQEPIRLTNLGASLTASSIQPIAAIGHFTGLPTAEVLGAAAAAAAANVKVAATEASHAIFESAAPQFQEHASVWQDVIAAGRSGTPLVVNGSTLENPHIVTTDTMGNPIQVPLSLAVDASSTTIPITEAIKPAAISASHRALAFNTFPAVIPRVLLAANLSGNEKTTVPAGFILADHIKLFGNLAADRYTFKGTATDDGKAEMAVVIQAQTTMDDLLPSLGFSFGKITILHPTVTAYSDKSSTGGHDMGLWLDASISLDDSMTEVGTFLKDVFGKTSPSLDISVHLGGYQGLSDALKIPADLGLKATLPGIDVKIGKFLELKSAEIDIHGARAVSPATGYTWTVSITGSAYITVPGSIAPLAVNYTISKTGPTYNVVLKIAQATWTDAMGVPGFHLDNVTMKSSFTTGTKDSAFTFDIDASLTLDTNTISITGHYAGDSWNFSAKVGDLTLQQLESAFSKLFKANLAPCDHDVVFNSLSLDVSSTDKTLLLKGGVSIDNYKCATAVLSITAHGVDATGDMDKVTFEKVTVSKAHMELLISKNGLIDSAPTKSGTAAAFTISGEVQIGSAVVLDAEVSFARDGSTSVWVVYAQAKATDKLTLSKFVSVPQDLDFQLESVVAMASNTNSAAMFPAKAFAYKVQKGFILSGTIDCPKHLLDTLRIPQTTMVLELDLNGVQKEVSLSFTGDRSLVLKKGMVSPQIKVGIKLSPPSLFIACDMLVQLSGQPDPLDFQLGFSFAPTEAQGFATCSTDWVNPFHISPKVKVLAPVTLGVIIDYAAVTYPSGLSFQGGIQIGETQLRAAFEVGENPQDGVLLVKAEQLGIKDIISFASLVVEENLPMPSSDYIFFKELDLEISSGGTIGTTTYPPGATFNANMLLFGEEVTINCALDKQLPGLKLHGEIDPFALGPLKVSGDKTSKPTLDLEFGTKLQHLLVDGKITLFDSEIAINIKADLVPLNLTFDAELKFSELFLFTVQAHASGKIESLKDVVKADFSLYAEFEQQLLDYMMSLANTYIAAAKKVSDEGIDSAKDKLTSVQKTYDDHIALCNRDLNDAKAKWDKKNADVTSSVNARISQIKADEQTKRTAVDQAQAAFNKKITALTNDLNQKKTDATNSINAAQANFDNVRQSANTNVNDAKNKLDNAQADMTRQFGNANNAIQDAQNRVNGARGEVDRLNNQISDIDNQIDHLRRLDPRRAQLDLEKAGYQAALTGANAGLSAANLVLSNAKDVMNSAGYRIASGTLQAAQVTLNGAKSAADNAISGAQRSLDAAKDAANFSISTAQNTLNAAEKSCDELNVWNIAKKALDDYTQAETGLLSTANQALRDLSKCAEKFAFDSADAALKVATQATQELDNAKSILNEVEHAADEFAGFASWLVSHGGNIFNVKSVIISGSLNDAARKKPLMAAIKGTFADAPVDVSVEFIPGQAEAFVKGLVMNFINEAKADLKKFIKV